MTPLRSFFSRSVWVRTTRPGMTGVVQEAGVPLRPSISIRHIRQEPKASTMSVAQSFGICVPASIAARMIEVPSGTVMLWPSMVSVTMVSDLERGVPKSVSWISDMAISLFRSLKALGSWAEIFPEVFERARHGVGRETAEGAQRAEFHGVAEVFDDGEVLLDPFAGANLVDGLDASRRADPEERALAVGFDGAEFHGKTRLFQHVDGVVEHHDAGMTDQTVARGKRLIIERRVEQRAGEISSKWAADLHRADRAAGKGTAADLVDEFTERDAEGRLEQAALFDVAGKLDRHRAARTTHAEIGIRLGATGEDEGDRRKRQHVVDHGRLAEQAFVRGERRLGADEAAPAFEAFQKRGLFAANVSAGADPHLQIEVVLRAADVLAEIAGLSGGCDRGIHRLDRVRIFRADVDVAFGGADGDAGNRHALDHHEGIALHDHAVGKGAAVAFVGIANNEFAVSARLRHRLPFDAGRKARAAAATQSRSRHVGQNCIRCQRQRALEAFVAVVSAIILHRTRIDVATPCEGEAGLG